MRFRTRLMRVGPVPPPAGPERQRFLREQGELALQQARRSYGGAVRDALDLTARAGVSLPAWRPPVRVPREATSAPPTVLQRIRSWDRVRTAVLRAYSFEAEVPMPGEELARAALSHASDAFNYLEDDPLAENAHSWLHRTGELVGGLYECRIELDRDAWMHSCAVTIGHIRFGASPGFTSIRYCTICDEDISECDHVPGELYTKIAVVDAEGLCSICGSHECPEHMPGLPYQVPAGVRLELTSFDEASLVARPRDPLARFEAIEVSEDALLEHLGSRPRSTDRVRCTRCIGSCSGFTNLSELLPPESLGG